MLRANLIRPQQLVVEQVAIPEPGPGEVRIRLETCGICGTDLHAYHGKHPFITLPIQPGHEFAGVIDALGPGVTGWEVGLRVTAEPSLVCGNCDNCHRGDYHICYKLAVIGCQVDGALAEYLTVPANKLVALPDRVSFEQGTLIEPLAVGIHATKMAPLRPESRLVILGAGTIGLMCLLAARARGVREITITDRFDHKLALAAQLGATHTVNVEKTNLIDFAYATLKHRLIFDVAIECAGHTDSVRDGITTLTKGGTFILAGVFPQDVPVSLGLVQDRELKLHGSLMYQIGDFVTALNLIASKRAPVENLITSRWPLEQVGPALQAIDQNPAQNIKTMIHIRPQS